MKFNKLFLIHFILLANYSLGFFHDFSDLDKKEIDGQQEEQNQQPQVNIEVQPAVINNEGTNWYIPSYWIGKGIASIAAHATNSYAQHEKFKEGLVKAQENGNEFLVKPLEKKVEDATKKVAELKEDFKKDGGYADEFSNKFFDNAIKGGEKVADVMGKKLTQNLVTTVKEASQEAAKYILPVTAAMLGLWLASKYAWARIDQHLKLPSINFNKPTWFLPNLNIPFRSNNKKSCDTMFFDDETREELMDKLRETRETNLAIKSGDKQGHYQHLLITGPIGVGKTLFSKQFAFELFNDQEVKMAHFFVPDSTFFTPTKNGDELKKIDILFENAKKCQNGALIFIDEAELLLSNNLSESAKADLKWHQVIRKIFSYLKEPNNNYMVIFASNKNFNLSDEAKSIFHTIKIGLPKYQERLDILKYFKGQLEEKKNYSNKFIKSVIVNLSESRLEQIAKNFDGVSGKDLANLIDSIKQNSRIKDQVSPEIVNRAIKQLKLKYPNLK